jgi:hypothetical protein
MKAIIVVIEETMEWLSVDRQSLLLAAREGGLARKTTIMGRGGITKACSTGNCFIQSRMTLISLIPALSSKCIYFFGKVRNVVHRRMQEF